MTYEFEHKHEGVVIQIKAEFKGKPKVFEVGIVKYEIIVGIPPHREPANLSSQEDRSHRSAFWNNAKTIYDEIVAKKGKVNK